MSDNNSIGFNFFSEPQQDLYTPITPEPTQQFYTPVIQPPVENVFGPYTPYTPAAPVFEEPIMTLPYQAEAQASTEGSWLNGVLGAVSGYIGNNSAFEDAANKSARNAYFNAQESALGNAIDGFKKAPGIIVSAAEKSMNAMRQRYDDLGLRAADIYEANMAKADEFIRSNDQNVRLSPDVIKDRVTAKVPAGDYIVRVVPAKRLDSLEDAATTQSEKAFIASYDEVGGYGNRDEFLRDAGLKQSAIDKVTDGSHVALVYRTKDLNGLIPATWDAVIDHASKEKEFKQYSDANPNLWNEIADFNYKEHLEASKQTTDYGKTLSPSDENLFNARKALDKRYGANENFTGKGYTQRTGTEDVGFREWLTDRQQFRDLEPYGMYQMRTGSSAPTIVDSIKSVPKKLISINESTNGAAGAAIIGAGSKYFELQSLVKEGKMTQEEFDAIVLGETSAAATKSAIAGAAETVTERVVVNSTYADSAEKVISKGVDWVTEKAGKYIPEIMKGSGGVVGKVARKIGGSSIAGTLAGAGLSIYENGKKYLNNEMSLSQAVARATADTSGAAVSSAVGVGAGMATTAVISRVAGSGVGTALSYVGWVGGPLGFAVGIGAGVATDYILKETGADQWIARNVESGVQAIGSGLSTIGGYGKSAWDWATDW